MHQDIINIITNHYPNVQAIYLFGTYGTDDEWQDSDIDIAVLLPHETAKKLASLVMSDCRWELERELHKNIDLINIRCVSTVFQTEIISANRKIDCRDTRAADEFEMLTLSYYQQLNFERKEILEEIKTTGKVLNI
ncbi:nucleotidyltransferase domain-containing protein [candidate division KSB1 bacterium]|nr:nucleotidyltransferase domain-containing protein [candidate division KSB1 bacterium]